jgi:hypothetical protein
MSEVRFDFEWADPLGAKGPELRATWARLAIWADDRCVSRVLDQNAKTIRDGVYVPLYPLAEWLATHWWNLLVEVPSPERLADPSYNERHSLRAARDGFALPPASFAGVGDHIRLRWHREKLPNYRVEFIEDGSAYIPIAKFKESATSFIGAVISRLEANGINTTLLQDEWGALQALSDEEQEFCQTAAALGLDPFGIDPSTETTIVEAAESVPGRLLSDFVRVASADNLPAEANDVRLAYNAAQENDSALGSLLVLRSDLLGHDSALGVAPWTRGYIAARRLRELLSLGNAVLPSFEHIAHALAISEGALAAALVSVPGATGIYDALVATNRRQSPAFAISPRHNKAAHRFHFCRGLYEFLRAYDDGPWLVTKSLADDQKQSRAFAAEFLAPAAALRDHVSASTVSADDVDDIAEQFGVSTYVIHHQLENHKIASVLPT